jgi:V8-like Glu-specific endopeptidase
MRSRLQRLAIAALLVLVGGFGVSASAASASTVARVPVATPAALTGALFLAGTNVVHSCTAGVVHSTRRDLIVTAAHCLVGLPSGVTFAPGYAGHPSAAGTWTVRRAWVDRRWLVHRDPRYDLAILAVRPHTRHGKPEQLEDVVRGARLGVVPAAGTALQVSGYTVGLHDQPVSCQTTLYFTAAWPSFDCPGFADGTSGSPWLTSGSRGLSIVGVIGGLHQGGCVPTTSYSAPFGAWSTALLARAERHARADLLPFAGSDGC